MGEIISNLGDLEQRSLHTSRVTRIFPTKKDLKDSIGPIDRGTLLGAFFGVLPGTGGLTRIVDKRKVRRDLADAFCTLAEGVRGKRAVEWGLVDEAPPKPKYKEAVKARLTAVAKRSPRKTFAPMIMSPLEVKRTDAGSEYRYVSLALDPKTRVATLTVRAPEGKQPTTPDELAKAGADAWLVRAFRELDDALLDLRFNQPDIGTVALKTSGDAAAVLAADEMLAKYKDDGLVHEVTLLVKRVLKRLDVTAKSFFASDSTVEPSVVGMFWLKYSRFWQ